MEQPRLVFDGLLALRVIGSFVSAPDGYIRVFYPNGASYRIDQGPTSSWARGDPHVWVSTWTRRLVEEAARAAGFEVAEERFLRYFFGTPPRASSPDRQTDPILIPTPPTRFDVPTSPSSPESFGVVLSDEGDENLLAAALELDDQADQNIIEFSDEDDMMLNWDEPAGNIIDLPSDDDMVFNNVPDEEDIDWEAHMPQDVVDALNVDWDPTIGEDLTSGDDDFFPEMDPGVRQNVVRRLFED